MQATSAEIEAIFYEALQKEPLSEQAAYLDHACGEDAELRAEVESLLTAHAKAVGLFESPVVSGVMDEGVAKLTEGPGTLIARYKLLELIGEGGFGDVYLAEQQEPVRRKVALKIIKPGMDSKQVIARFEAEEQALAMMEHPNIAKVHDAGATESGRPYFVMELVDGIPLTEYCDANDLTAKERLGLFIDVCHAVQHAHQKGIIHRDIKPTNVMVALQDGVPVPKIIDFGIAKATDRHLTERTAFTSYGQMIGTPLYMSPEQAEMSGLDIDTRSDIYSLGVLLYELLTGSTPFDEERIRAAGYDEMRRLIREEEPPRPSDRISSLAAEAATTASTHRKTDPARLSHLLRGELDWIVLKALEKDRTRRYETANAFANDIRRYLHDDPVEACPPSASYRLRKFARRHKVAFVTTSLVAAALVLGIAGTTWQAIRATIESNRAGKAEQAASDRYQGELAARQEMERQRDRAEAAETEAKAEAAIAQAINDFLRNDLLAEAAPEKNARNEKVTVEELLGRAASKIAGKFDQQPRIEAAILRTIGETYRALGDYEAAQPHLERALQLGRRSVGEEHPDTLTTIDSLGLLYLEHGRPAEAELLLAKNLKVRSRVLGKEHEDTLESMNNLAGAHYGQGHYDEAEQLLAETWEIRRRMNGEEHPDTVMAANNLASIYIRHGQLVKAEMLVAKNVEILSRIRGKEHPNTILAMHNLAVLSDEQGRHAEAETLFFEALGAARRVLGEEHPSTLSYMQSLASLLDRQDRDVEAESLYVEALDASRRVWGEEHTETLGCLNNLVTLYLSQGDPKAEPLFVELLALQRRVLGDEHPDTLDSMRTLAMFYAFEDQPTKTGQLLLEILEIRRRTLGEQHPDTQTAIDALLGHYRNQGQLDQAEQLLRRSLDTLEQNAPDAWTTFHTKSRLGDVLASQQKFAEAEPLLLAGYEGMSQRAEKIPPPHKKCLTQALQRIIKLYKAWDKPHQTPQWRAKLKALNEEHDEQLKTDTPRNREEGEHQPSGN